MTFTCFTSCNLPIRLSLRQSSISSSCIAPLSEPTTTGHHHIITPSRSFHSDKRHGQEDKDQQAAATSSGKAFSVLAACLFQARLRAPETERLRQALIVCSVQLLPHRFAIFVFGDNIFFAHTEAGSVPASSCQAGRKDEAGAAGPDGTRGLEEGVPVQPWPSTTRP